MFVSHRPYFQLCTLLTLLTLPWMETAKLLAATTMCMLMDQNLHLHLWQRWCKGPDTYTHLPSGHLHLQILQLNRSQTQLALMPHKPQSISPPEVPNLGNGAKKANQIKCFSFSHPSLHATTKVRRFHLFNTVKSTLFISVILPLFCFGFLDDYK